MYLQKKVLLRSVQLSGGSSSQTLHLMLFPSRYPSYHPSDLHLLSTFDTRLYHPASFEAPPITTSHNHIYQRSNRKKNSKARALFIASITSLRKAASSHFPQLFPQLVPHNPICRVHLVKSVDLHLVSLSLITLLHLHLHLYQCSYSC